MGRYSQTMILVLKLLIRKELGSPRRLVVPIIILSIILMFSSVGTALIEIDKAVYASPKENIIFETRLDHTRVLLLCKGTSLHTLYTRNETVTINIGKKINLDCYRKDNIMVCYIECNSIKSTNIISNLKGKVVYEGRIPALLNTIISSYNSIFDRLYYTMIIMFVISTGGISYGFAGNVRNVFKKLSYWGSINTSFLLISVMISLYIVALSLSISILTLYSVSLILSVLLSAPYIRPLPDTILVIILFIISWITIMTGLKLGVREY